MIRVALTGSIGMGKSETLRMFARIGAATWDADAAVHRLYAPGGGAAPLIAKAFPGAVASGGVDRAKLSRSVLNDPGALARLEAIVHPLVHADEAAFAQRAEADGAPLAVFDIPLLFETGREGAFDAVVVVTAPEEVRRARVLARPGMNVEKFETIRTRQMPETEKRARADYVIETDGGLDKAFSDVQAVVADLKKRFAHG